MHSHQNCSDAKRNLGALKNSPVHGLNTPTPKQKREVTYSILDDSNPELVESNYQSNPFDYEELAQAMYDTYPLYFKSDDEKRYLGKQLPITVMKSE